jgi:predicted O-methyltransferase YrrM
MENELLNYAESFSSEESDVLKTIYRETYLTQINPRMVSGHLQGRILSFLVKICQPNRILEIGTFTAYSTICMGESLKPNSIIDTIEINQELKTTIVDNLKKAGLDQKVNLYIGDAIKILEELLDIHQYDFIFLDADKANYPLYFKILKDKLKSGSILIADNVLWNGKVVSNLMK